MDSKRILIVGAGPTGASLALLLARRGIDVVLIERESNLHRIFRGEGMMPGGIEALAQMGLREKIEQLPHCKLDRWEYYLGQKLLARFPEPDRNSPNAIRVLSQPHLLEMMVAEARTLSSLIYVWIYSRRRGARWVWQDWRSWSFGCWGSDNLG